MTREGGGPPGSNRAKKNQRETASKTMGGKHVGGGKDQNRPVQKVLLISQRNPYTGNIKKGKQAPLLTNAAKKKKEKVNPNPPPDFDQPEKVPPATTKTRQVGEKLLNNATRRKPH